MTHCTLKNANLHFLCLMAPNARASSPSLSDVLADSFFLHFGKVLVPSVIFSVFCILAHSASSGTSFLIKISSLSEGSIAKSGRYPHSSTVGRKRRLAALPTTAHYDTPDHLKWRRRSLITVQAHAGGGRGCSQTQFNSEKKNKREEGEKWEGLEGYETLRLNPRLPCIPRHWSRRSHKSLLTPTVNGYKKAPGFLYVTWSLLLEGKEEKEEECRGTLERSKKYRSAMKWHIFPKNRCSCENIS